MKAVVAPEPLAVDDPRALVDADLPEPPRPAGHDLRVRVEAVSVNPLDTKMRRMAYAGASAPAGPRVLGWDAAGVVESAGDAVTLFRPGDAVMYAGSNQRPGSNAQLQLVDERIVGPTPASLGFADAAALPLTTLTAYEALVDRIGFDGDGMDAGQSLLVIGGAGGVGSMAIQIGRHLGLTVIATAAREDSAAWCRALGARHVVDRRTPLRDALHAVGIGEVDAILNCADTEAYWAQMEQVIRPQGSICSIVANRAPLDLKLLQRKCVRFSWEAMFTRSSFATPDMIEQHRILARVAAWVDAGHVRSTATERLAPICAAQLREAHRRVESGQTIGKIVLAGW